MKKLLLFMGLLGMSSLSHAQFSESFEGGTTIPTGWTVINQGDTNTWTVISLASSTTLTAQQGTNVATIQYSASAHNDYLVTPAITVTNGVSNFLSFWGRSRDPQYPETISVKLSTTTPTAAAFTTTLIPNVAPASGPNFQRFVYDLSSYAGQTVYIAFHSTTTDQFVFDLDSVVVTALPTCDSPGAPSVSGTVTPNAATINWTAPSIGAPIGYEFQYGPTGFALGTGTILTPTSPTISLSTLTEGTVYQYYIRTKCSATEFSNWSGPFTFTTPYGPASLPYAEGFEGDIAGWTVDSGDTGASWGIGEAPTVPAQEGTSSAVVGASAAESDAWLFSRGLNLTAGVPVTVSYYLTKLIGAGTGNVNNLSVTIGTDNTVDGIVNIIGTLNNYAPTTYTLQSHTFTPTTTGVYFIGFNYTAPAHVQANFGRLALDNVTVSTPAGTNDILVSQLSVYPNPATNVINVTNADNILVNGVEIVDLNGRTVKVAKFDGVTEAQINISDLSAGMYMMTVSSDKGTLTKKIVKQ